MIEIASPARRRVRDDIARAAAHLRAGGLVVYPTETAYAIGCDATQLNAVAAVFRAKGRTSEKSLPLIVHAQDAAERYAEWSNLAERIANAYWPGPLTLVLRARSISPPLLEGEPEEVLAPGVIASNGTIALRVSSHPIARALAETLGRPIVATSANRSGEPPAYSVAEAASAFSDGSIVVLDGGDLAPRAPSTIVDVTGVAPRVLRVGCVAFHVLDVERVTA